MENKTARGIYFTNCFRIGSSPTATAMLPRLSRINHSCCPNTEFHWEEGQGAEHLRAVRDIRQAQTRTIICSELFDTSETDKTTLGTAVRT